MRVLVTGVPPAAAFVAETLILRELTKLTSAADLCVIAHCGSNGHWVLAVFDGADLRMLKYGIEDHLTRVLREIPGTGRA